MKKVSRAQFDYRDFAPEDRLQAFRRMTSSIYQIWAAGDEQAFAAEVMVYRLGSLLFNEMTCSPARFLRGPQHLSDHFSHFLVLQTQLSGTELISMAHGIFRLQPGHIYLRDWRFPFESQAGAMHLRSIVIPRQLLHSSIVFSESNPVLSWSTSEPKGELLLELWWRLIAKFEQVDLGTAEVLCRSFLGFLDGLIGGVSHHEEEQRVKLHSMEQYLHAQLRGDIGVDQVCARFHISRATAFRLFKPHGGITHYLHRLRLDRCYQELHTADPGQVSIGQIAAGWGFTEPRAFLRKFRAQFGVAPSEVFASGFRPENKIGGPGPAPDGDQQLVQNYTNWLRGLAASPQPAK